MHRLASCMPCQQRGPTKMSRNCGFGKTSTHRWYTPVQTNTVHINALVTAMLAAQHCRASSAHLWHLEDSCWPMMLYKWGCRAERPPCTSPLACQLSASQRASAAMRAALAANMLLFSDLSRVLHKLGARGCVKHTICKWCMIAH